MNSYETKQAARKARLEKRANQLASEAQATHQTARTMAAAIPLGQPILCGHHSERRDRNYRDKIHKKFGRSFELQKAAERTAQRAAAVGTAGISSDDPDAPDKIKARIAELEDAQRQMVEFNAGWRRAGKPAPDDQEGWKRVADILGRSDNDLLRLRTDMAQRRRFGQGKQPFEGYSLSNNSGNLARLRKRLEQVEQRAAVAAETPEIERMVGDVRVVENVEDNRLQLFFPGKPDKAVRDDLKQSGFRWAPSVGAWQAFLTNASKWRAGQILGVEL